MRLTGMKIAAVLLGVTLAVSAGGVLARQIGAREETEPRPRVEESSRPEPADRAAARADGFDDPLPPGALARLGTMRLRHGGRFIRTEEGGSVILSRDGKGLITAGSDNPIRLWDAATGKLLCSFGDSKNPAVSIVLSPDGHTLAAGNFNGSISLWKVATGKLLRQLGAGIDALAFSRDGRTLLSVGRDNHLHVWEVATGKEVRDQPLQIQNDWKAGPRETSIFSPDGKTLASIHHADGNNIVYLWEAVSGKELRHLTLGQGWIPRGAVVFSSDSRFLAVSSITRDDGNRSDGAVYLWEVATGKQVRQWTPDKAGTRSVAFSPDGTILATGGNFGPIRLWDTATGKELRRCRGYQAHVVGLAFSPDGSTLASLAKLNDHTARLWEVASGKERLRTSRGHSGPVLSVAFSPDGKDLISGGRDGLVGFWNSETGQQQRPPLRAGDFQALAALSADGKTFLTIGNAYSPNDQSLLSAVRLTPTQVCVWDRTTGQKLRQFPGPVGAAQFLALSPDGKILVLASPQNVHLFEVATGKEVWYQFAVRNFLHAVALSPNDKTLALGRQGSVQLYAIDTRGHFSDGQIPVDGDVSCFAFSPDGQTLAVGEMENHPKEGNKHTIHLWHFGADKKWKEAGTLVGHQEMIWEVKFSPDNKTLASVSADGTARLWEVATGKERCCFAGHSGECWCLAFAPDGRRLATGGEDTTILVWDVTGRLQSGQGGVVKLSDKELEGLWSDLAGANAAQAGRALWTLVAAGPQTVSFLSKQIRPVTVKVSPEVVARLITDLNADNFKTRQKARRELAKLGEECKPALQQALAKQPTLEMRRSLLELLSKLEEARKTPAGEVLRGLRAVEVLEHIGSREARVMLKGLTTGAGGSPLTLEARSALERLDRTEQR